MSAILLENHNGKEILSHNNIQVTFPMTWSNSLIELLAAGALPVS
jgi:hypothetical protein